MQTRKLLGLCAFILSSALFAQTASIQGIVKDQTDAAVVGAQVVVTNLDTGLRREATSNETG
jgi:Carboxypeptidase regulatory-like domain